jgi:hypothetical protein
MSSRRYTRDELAEGLAAMAALEDSSARWEREAVVEASLVILAGQPAFLWTADRGVVRYDTLAALTADRGPIPAPAPEGEA